MAKTGAQAHLFSEFEKDMTVNVTKNPMFFQIAFGRKTGGAEIRLYAGKAGAGKTWGARVDFANYLGVFDPKNILSHPQVYVQNFYDAMDANSLLFDVNISKIIESIYDMEKKHEEAILSLIEMQKHVHNFPNEAEYFGERIVRQKEKIEEIEKELFGKKEEKRLAESSAEGFYELIKQKSKSGIIDIGGNKIRISKDDVILYSQIAKAAILSNFYPTCLLLDEIDKAKSKTLETLLTFMSDGIVINQNTGQKITTKKENLLIIATSNDQNEMTEAQLRRYFKILSFDQLRGNDARKVFESILKVSVRANDETIEDIDAFVNSKGKDAGKYREMVKFIQDFFLSIAKESKALDKMQTIYENLLNNYPSNLIVLPKIAEAFKEMIWTAIPEMPKEKKQNEEVALGKNQNLFRSTAIQMMFSHLERSQYSLSDVPIDEVWICLREYLEKIDPKENKQKYQVLVSRWKKYNEELGNVKVLENSFM